MLGFHQVDSEWVRKGTRMERHELRELHYITPISNVPSILRHGILSHRRAATIAHDSVSMQPVQDKRASTRVPQGRRLHEYANLYICARNPMLYKRLSQRRTLCVLQVDVAVIDLPNVIVTDQNAASAYACFAPGADGLKLVDGSRTFADDWRHPDPIEYWRRKAAKCAEVLVPDRIESRFIRGAYVSCEEARATLDNLKTPLQVVINRHLFFAA